ARRELAVNVPPSQKRGQPRKETHDDEASLPGSRAHILIPPEPEYVDDEEVEWPEIPPT
ncbi:hypothetical protein A2U01_0035863, partial [Trifolium medium]|nr:hypothetical protein [Trifolium medium]